MDAERIKSYIDELFGNTDNPQMDTLSELEEIEQHVQTCIVALRSDMPFEVEEPT